VAERILRGVVALLLGSVAIGRSQVPARNAELGYTVAPLEGFREFPEGRRQKDVVDSWIETTPASAHGPVIVLVQRMHGVLPRERVRQEDLPATARLVIFKWKGFDIDGLSVLTAKDGVRVFVLASQVPLRREAVQVVVSGPEDQETRGPAIMTAILATLDGRSNWLSSTERAGRVRAIVGLWVVLAGALIAVLVWRKRRRAKLA
jgi:hypothetical protein